MDPTTIMALALQGLNAILSLIGSIRSQSGMTDADILAAAQATVGANDTLYATLKAHLATLPPAA